MDQPISANLTADTVFAFVYVAQVSYREFV